MVRIQWDNHCGEQSIQSVALENGIYISQQCSRNYIPDEGCLIQDSIDTELGIHSILNKLDIAYTQFINHKKNYESKRFLKWINRNKGKTVIAGLFMKYGGRHDEYDHVVIIKGFKGNRLVIHDFFNEEPQISQPVEEINLSAGQISKSRCKCSHYPQCEIDSTCGLKHAYYIPRDYCYGLVIHPKKIKLNLSLDMNAEPKYIEGERPILYKSILNIEGLQDSKSYTILKSIRFSLREKRKWIAFRTICSTGTGYLIKNIYIKSDSITEFKIINSLC